MIKSHPAAVTLRVAAAEWGDGLTAPVRGAKDSESLRRDRKLQLAAVSFAATIRGMSKRGYSRDFKPHGDTGKRYLIDDIPAGLWSDVRAKCKREGVSIRAALLTLLTAWVAETKEKG